MSTPRITSRRTIACALLGMALAAPAALRGRQGGPDPRLPSFAVSGVSVAEGGAGETTPATFTVTLSAPSREVVTVRYTTRDGTALAAAGDYGRAAGTLRFDPGLTSTTVEVTIRGDALEEADETLLLVLSQPQGATIRVGEATVEIVDDDGAAGPATGPELSIDEVRVSEGDGGRRQARFEVVLSDKSAAPVTVAFATADGSATAGEDYEAAAGQLRFPPGTTRRTVTVSVFGDGVREGDEDFVVELSEPVGATFGADLARGLILDDDGEGAVTLEPVGSPERRGRPGQTIVLLVRVNAAAGGAVAGSAVQWALDGDGELLDGPVTATGSDGVARQRLLLPSNPGRSAVRAEAAGANRAVLFQVAVGAGPGG